MKIRRGVIMAGAGGLVVLVAGWYASDAVYFSERAAIAREAEDLKSRTEAFNAAASGSREVRIALRELASTMLGAEQVVVEHRLRGLLSGLAEGHGLRDVVVSHGRPRVGENPAQERGSNVNRGLRRLLSDQSDFAAIHARVQGLGTLEQALETLAAIRAQPWIHRVEGFTISPKGRERTVYELKADVATIYAPDLVSAEAEPPGLVGPDPASAQIVSSLAQRDPFRLADPIVEAPPPPPSLPTMARPDPPPPYDRWRVTGVLETIEASGATAVQVLLARTDTGELRTMHEGDTLLGARLESASGESAWFEMDGRTVVVRTGQTLEQGEPVESVHSEAAGRPRG